MSTILAGMMSVCTPMALGLMLCGVVLGIVFGALPGLSATTGIALCLPLTFKLSPVDSIALLIGIYVGGISGSLISAILINVPGTAASVASCFDGHPMAQQGKAGNALGIGLMASFIGTLLSFIALVTIAPTLAQITIKFTPFEYFAIVLFSLTLIGTLISGSVVKGLLAGVTGVLLGCVGVAPGTGTLRFTFNVVELSAGLSQTPGMVGVFALGAQLGIISKGFKAHEDEVQQCKLKGFGMPLADWIKQIPNIIRSALLGIGIGILPGIGGGTSNLIAYGVAKSCSKYPEKFGTGIPDGIVASETSNNASVGGALIPLLTVGIPGDTVTAMLLGALTIQGLTPGPLLFNTNGVFVYGLFTAVLISTIMMIIVEYSGMRAVVKILGAPRYILLPVILVICMAGIFTCNNRVFDLWIMLFFGIIAFIMSRYGFPTAPMILGFILGPYLETYMVRANQLGRGSLMPIFQRPIAMGFLIVMAAFVVFQIYTNVKKMKAGNDNPIEDVDD